MESLVNNKTNIVNTNIKHLFISGPPRSGTTLLQLLLSEHSRIAISPETTFIQNLLIWELKNNVVIRGKIKEKLLGYINNDIKLSTWPHFDVSNFYSEVINNDFKVDELLNKLFYNYSIGCQKEPRYIGNKKEIYSQKYGIYIKKIFPDSKFIFIVRDPRDVVASSINNLYGYDLKRAAFNCYYMGYYIQKIRKLYPKDVFIIKYENLAKNPRTETKKICSFLDLDFQSSMLDFYNSNKDYKNLIGSTKNIHKNTNKPINSDNSFKWKRNNVFSEHELKCIEHMTFNYIKSFKYDSNGRRFNISSVFSKAICWKMKFQKSVYRKYKKIRKK
jgi:hypothetical protein